jgi:hypothetical protein
MDKNQKVIFEDFNKIYNKWVSGIAKREAQADVITVDDIVNKYRNNLGYEAPKTLPFPLDRSVEMLGDIFGKLSEYKTLIQQSSTNPNISEHKANIAQLKKIWKKVHAVQDIIFSITVNLNKIALKEPDTEDVESVEVDNSETKDN